MVRVWGLGVGWGGDGRVGAVCVRPLGRERFWAGFPSMRCPDVLHLVCQDGADLLHLYRPSVG